MTYSQFGEEALIAKTVKEITRGYAVDVGAGDGISCSNTKALEDAGWQVLCIEANPLYAKRLRENRALVQVVAVAEQFAEGKDFVVYGDAERGYYEAYSALKPIDPNPVHGSTGRPLVTLTVPVRTLDWCLDEAAFPRVDVVSIDVEGGEMDVLAGFTLSRWQPKLLVIENWVETGPLRAYCADHGYKLAERLGVNDLYIKATNG